MKTRLPDQPPSAAALRRQDADDPAGGRLFSD
jgi:hypothetical protein